LAVRAQLLATEHWSLLATRSMTWSEVFSRTTMLLTIASAAMVALALVAQTRGATADLRPFALAVLGLVLVVGLVTQLRVNFASTEDLALVIGMNRLRAAYVQLAPELCPYFVTSPHDDDRGIEQTYSMGVPRNASQVIGSAATVVALVNAVVAGMLMGLAAAALGASTRWAVVAGIVGGLVLFLVVILLGGLQYVRIRRILTPMFPSGSPPAAAPAAGSGVEPDSEGD
jgi:hypothetical protein